MDIHHPVTERHDTGRMGRWAPRPQAPLHARMQAFLPDAGTSTSPQHTLRFMRAGTLQPKPCTRPATSGAGRQELGGSPRTSTWPKLPRRLPDARPTVLQRALRCRPDPSNSPSPGQTPAGASCPRPTRAAGGRSLSATPFAPRRKARPKKCSHCKASQLALSLSGSCGC